MAKTADTCCLPAIYSGLSISQLLVARKLKHSGAHGSGAAIASKALGIATLYVGAGACGFLGLLGGAFGLNTAADYRAVAEEIRRAARREPRLEDPSVNI